MKLNHEISHLTVLVFQPVMVWHIIWMIILGLIVQGVAAAAELMAAGFATAYAEAVVAAVWLGPTDMRSRHFPYKEAEKDRGDLEGVDIEFDDGDLEPRRGDSR